MWWEKKWEQSLVAEGGHIVAAGAEWAWWIIKAGGKKQSAPGAEESGVKLDGLYGARSVAAALKGGSELNMLASRKRVSRVSCRAILLYFPSNIAEFFQAILLLFFTTM